MSIKKINKKLITLLLCFAMTFAAPLTILAGEPGDTGWEDASENEEPSQPSENEEHSQPAENEEPSLTSQGAGGTFAPKAGLKGSGAAGGSPTFRRNN